MRLEARRRRAAAYPLAISILLLASSPLGCWSAAARPGAVASPATERSPGAGTPAAGFAAHRIAYGAEPSQFGELRVPPGRGPHPVVVLVHGGCWKREFGSVRDLAAMADSLAASGVATWNVEYRRVGEPGGGWPGTFSDVSTALGHLATLAPAHRLDPARVVVLGHSAGGTLALWVAARHRRGTEGATRDASGLRLRGVVTLAGVTDLERRARAPGEGRCSERAVESLLGGSPADVPHRYAQASPVRLLPLRTAQVHVWGREDNLMPSRYGDEMVEAASRAGDSARLVLIDGAGHFDTARPLPPAWLVVRDAIRSLLARP